MAFSLRAVFNEAVEIGKAAVRMVNDFVAPAQEHAFTGGSSVHLASAFAAQEARAVARSAPVMDGIKKGSPFGNAR